MLISLLNFSRKFSKLPTVRGRVDYQLRTSKSGVCLDQNWMFVDREEEVAGCVKFRLFCGRHKCMTPYQILFRY